MPRLEVLGRSVRLVMEATMPNTTVNAKDHVKRALVKLNALRENLDMTGYVEQGVVDIFNNALDELQQAGEDVSEWEKISPSEVYQGVDQHEFRARVDAIVTSFTVHQERLEIGFRK